MSDLFGLAGIFVAVLVALAGVFRFLWSEVKQLETRLRYLENEYRILQHVTRHLDQKLQEDSPRLKEQP